MGTSQTAEQDPQDRMKHIFIHPGQFDRQYQGTCPDSPAIQASLRRHIIAYQYPRHLVPLNTIWQIYYTADASPSRLSCYCQLLSLHKLCRPLSQHVHVTSSHCLPYKPHIEYRTRFTRKTDVQCGKLYVEPATLYSKPITSISVTLKPYSNQRVESSRRKLPICTS